MINTKYLNQHLDDKSIQQLHVIIKQLNYGDTMDIEYLLKYFKENKVT